MLIQTCLSSHLFFLRALYWLLVISTLVHTLHLRALLAGLKYVFSAVNLCPCTQCAFFCLPIIPFPLQIPEDQPPVCASTTSQQQDYFPAAAPIAFMGTTMFSLAFLGLVSCNVGDRSDTQIDPST